MLAGRGVAIAQRAASLVVSGARAELRSVERREEASSTNLPRNGRQRVLRGSWTGRCVLRRIGDARPGAAIGVADEYAARAVNRDVVEVEQIAAWIVSAAVPDAAALNRIVRRCIRGRPGLPAVIRERDVEMPGADEVGCLRVPLCRCSEECERRTAVVAGDDLCELGVLNAKRRSRIRRLGPVSSAIARHGNLRVTVAVSVAEIDRIVRAGCDRGVAAAIGQ